MGYNARNDEIRDNVTRVGMKKKLILSFLLFGLKQSSAQELPSYDLTYYDSARCVKM